MSVEKSVLEAKTPSDLLLIQFTWMTGNLERSMAYWTQMFRAAADANVKLLESLSQQE
jgi:hypothetical protein